MPQVRRLYASGNNEVASSVTLYAAVPDVETFIAVTEGTMWFKLADGSTVTAGHGTLVSLLPGELVEYGAVDGSAKFIDIHVLTTPESESRD